MTDKEKFLNELRGLQRIVINDCYGGFSLSDRAIREYKKLAGIKEDDKEFYDRDIPRDDPYLVKIVKELGMGANGSCANLKIVEVPADVDWMIAEYDGAEWVAEVHRTWS
jgi:hypothetical protein